MDADTAARIKAHMRQAIIETNQALILVREHCTTEEFEHARRDAGYVIAHAENFLCESAYIYHPELDELHEEFGSKPFRHYEDGKNKDD